MPSKNQQSSNWELSKSFQFSIARALGTFKKFATLTLAVAMLWSCNKEGDVRVTCSNNLTELDCTDQSFHIDTTKSGRKVLLIGIDGFRPDGIHADIAPNLFRLANSDSSFYTNEHIVEDLTFSGPNWSSILNGVHWCKHRVQDNDYSSHELARFPHFFYYLENALDSVNTASISHWLPINEHVAAPYGDYVPMDSWNDADIFAQATDLISNAVPLAPDVVFLQFDELDAAGHNYGFDPDIEEYAATITTIDGYVGGLMQTIEQARANDDDWLVMVVSDHGGCDTGHSGGQDNDFINKTIFIANHPTAAFRENYISSQADLAATILDFMGVESAAFNCKTDGISLLQ